MFGENSKVYLKRILKNKVKGSLLPLVLILSLVIALICFGAINNTFFHRKLDIKYQNQTRLIHNANSGIQYLLAYNLEGYTDDLMSVSLTDNDSVKLYKKKWGLFDIALAEASLPSNQTYSKAAIIGSKPGKFFSSSVYLADNKLPLKLSGKTKLYDILFLPEAGIRTGFVHKTGYLNTKLIYGNTFNSKKELPVLVKDTKSIFNPVFMNEIYIEELEDTTYTFHTLLTNVYEDDEIYLTESISGNLVIRAGTVKISNTASINEVLIVADSVVVEDNFHGRLNIISSNYIQIGKRSIIDYPSQLIASDSASIILRENVNFNGIIAGFSNNNSIYFRAEKGCSIFGYCYINGLSEIQGSVSGNISTYNFTVTENDKKFNYNLYNAEVSFKKLPPYILGAVEMGKKKGVAKWLY